MQHCELSVEVLGKPRGVLGRSEPGVLQVGSEQYRPKREMIGLVTGANDKSWARQATKNRLGDRSERETLHSTGSVRASDDKLHLIVFDHLRYEFTGIRIRDDLTMFHGGEIRRAPKELTHLGLCNIKIHLKCFDRAWRRTDPVNGRCSSINYDQLGAEKIGDSGGSFHDVRRLCGEVDRCNHPGQENPGGIKV